MCYFIGFISFNITLINFSVLKRRLIKDVFEHCLRCIDICGDLSSVKEYFLGSLHKRHFGCVSNFFNHALWAHLSAILDFFFDVKKCLAALPILNMQRLSDRWCNGYVNSLIVLSSSRRLCVSFLSPFVQSFVFILVAFYLQSTEFIKTSNSCERTLSAYILYCNYD